MKATNLLVAIGLFSLAIEFASAQDAEFVDKPPRTSTPTRKVGKNLLSILPPDVAKCFERCAGLGSPCTDGCTQTCEQHCWTNPGVDPCDAISYPTIQPIDCFKPAISNIAEECKTELLNRLKDLNEKLEGQQKKLDVTPAPPRKTQRPRTQRAPTSGDVSESKGAREPNLENQLNGLGHHGVPIGEPGSFGKSHVQDNIGKWHVQDTIGNSYGGSWRYSSSGGSGGGGKNIGKRTIPIPMQ